MRPFILISALAVITLGACKKDQFCKAPVQEEVHEETTEPTERKCTPPPKHKKKLLHLFFKHPPKKRKCKAH